MELQVVRRMATGTRCSIILGSVDVFLWLALCYIFWMDLVIVQLKGKASRSLLEFCEYTLCIPNATCMYLECV